jgi:hypothetical protein
MIVITKVFEGLNINYAILYKKGVMAFSSDAVYYIYEQKERKKKK